MNELEYKGNVLVKWDDRLIFLDHHGWKTDTTRARMNQCAVEHRLGFRVIQRSSGWQVHVQVENQDAVVPFDNPVIIRRPQ